MKIYFMKNGRRVRFKEDDLAKWLMLLDEESMSSQDYGIRKNRIIQQ